MFKLWTKCLFQEIPLFLIFFSKKNAKIFKKVNSKNKQAMPRLLITYYKLTFVYRVYSSLWGEYTLSEPGP